MKDITGNKSNMLTAIEYAGKNEKGQSLWKCLCDCGNEKIIPVQKFGTTKSCGCLRHKTNHKFIDLTGKEIGHWKVLRRGKNKVTPSGYQRTMWTCLCDCGNIKDVDATNLLKGASISCGCKIEKEFKSIIVGNRYDELVVVKQLDLDKPITNNTRWLCKCDCGGEVIIRGEALNRNGKHNCRKCNQIRGYRIEKGYRYVYKPEYPNNENGWIREHKYVYETETGSFVPNGYNLHHIDMDKLNNSLTNLYLCTSKEHAEAHASLNAIIKKLLENGIIEFSNGEYIRTKK